MDQLRFDAFVRNLAFRLPRRRIGSLTALLVALGVEQSDAKRRSNRQRKKSRKDDRNGSAGDHDARAAKKQKCVSAGASCKKPKNGKKAKKCCAGLTCNAATKQCTAPPPPPPPPPPDGGGGSTCGASQYKAEYWNNTNLSGTPALVRCENWPLGVTWGDSAPGPGVSAENFSARWTGRASLEAGDYDFIAFADDRMRVWLNGELIINNWDTSLVSTTLRKTMPAGMVDIKVEFQEFSYSAAAYFRWERAGSCTPNCTNKTCGSNGCGGSCGTCSPGRSCQNGQCVSTCVPNCAGKVCGSDGCSGTCGTCTGGKICQSGQCIGPPATPTGLTAVALDTSRIRLTWNDVSGETGYRIHNGDNLVATVPANTTSYTVTGLAPNTYKCHFVQAFNNGGSSTWSGHSCTSTRSLCSQDSQCDDGNVCTVGRCEQGVCQHRAAACKVRLFIVLPSDWMGSTTHRQLGSPSQATILQAGRNARDRIKTFFSQKAELPLRFDDVQVLMANHNTEWFNTAPASASRSPEQGRFVFEEEYMSPPGSETQPGARTSAAAASWDPSHQWGRMFSYLQEAGFGGRCASGWISLVILGSTWRGGFAGGGVCGTTLKQLPNSAPDTGPHTSGIAMVGQWVLDSVITGQTSISCEQRQGGDPAGGPGAWQCPANTAWGTLIHELGHTLSLNHPDSAWERQNWNLSQATWATMVMMNHSGYPNVGFHPYERAVLAGLPPLQTGTATLSAREEQQQGERAAQTDKRRQPSKTDRDRNRLDRSNRRDKKGPDRSKRRGGKGGERSGHKEPRAPG